MESLHAATIFLLRYGGMHPFKTTSGSDQPRISVGLLLWTVFLQLVNALSFVHYMTQIGTFNSLHTFIGYVWQITWGFTTILVPIHFLCHAKKIAAVNRQINKIISICSIQRLKLNIKSKLMIYFLVFGKIIPITCNALDSVTCRISEYGTPISKITFTFIAYHAFFIEAVTSFIFAVYLSILVEYFSLFDASLGELFDGMQISVTPMEEYNDTPSNPELYPLNGNKSTIAQHSVQSLKTTDILPNSCPIYDDTKCSELYAKSLRTNTVSTQTDDNNANILDFFQILEETHASIFEVYKIYEGYESILGFPLLFFTFFYTITCCASSYTALEIDMGVTCFILLTLSSKIMFLNFVLLTSIPHTLNEKVRNDFGECLFEV